MTIKEKKIVFLRPGVGSTLVGSSLAHKY